MLDPLPGEDIRVDFEEYADHLLEQGLEVCPSRVHGCLCGLLAAGAPDEPDWGLSGVMQALDLVVQGEAAAQTLLLYAHSAAALGSEELDFYPLLPSDDVSIERRAAGLAAWCSGFLAGFAQAAAGGAMAAAVPAVDSAEVLQDFAAIAEAVSDEATPEEEQEASYTELVEYVRFAALNVYLDQHVGEARHGYARHGDARHNDDTVH